MSDSQKATGLFSNLKELSSFLRDASLTIVVVICLLQPSSIKTFLKESGLSKLNFFGFEVEIEKEEEKIATAQQKITAKVVSAASASQDEAPPEALNKPVDQDFKQAVIAAEKVAPQILPTSGWVFLGRVNKEKTQWADGGSSTTTASWPVVPDNVLTVRDDVYVRAITDDKWRSNAPVTTVAKIGDKLQVVELQYSSAKIGGFYVWAKVALQSN